MVSMDSWYLDLPSGLDQPLRSELHRAERQEGFKLAISMPIIWYCIAIDWVDGFNEVFPGDMDDNEFISLDLGLLYEREEDKW